MLLRDLTLSPRARRSPLERQAGYALALRVLPYAAPLLRAEPVGGDAA